MKQSPELRVAQFVKGLDIGNLHGGAEVFGLNLSCAIQERVGNSTLFVLSKTGTPAEEKYLDRLASVGVPVHFLNTYSERGKFKNYWTALRNLRKMLRLYPQDILHCHFHMGTFLAVLMKLIGRVKYVVRTAHGDHEWTRGWNGLVQQAIIRALIFIIFPLWVNMEAGVSRASVQVLDQRWLAWILKKKATVIFNSIPEKFSNTLPPSKERYQNTEKPVIGCIGRFTDQKGFEYCLTAVPQVVQVLPEAKFWIIGDGELDSFLREKAKALGIEDSVVFWGRREDIQQLFEQMTLFVLPSIYEGLPTVVLESMACGVPVVASNIPGTRDVIQDKVTGWVVPPRDSERLGKQILASLLDPDERYRIATVAYEQLSKFRMENTARIYLNAYHNLAGI